MFWMVLITCCRTLLSWAMHIPLSQFVMLPDGILSIAPRTCHRNFVFLSSFKKHNCFWAFQSYINVTWALKQMHNENWEVENFVSLMQTPWLSWVLRPASMDHSPLLECNRLICKDDVSTLLHPCNYSEVEGVRGSDWQLQMHCGGDVRERFKLTN